MRQRAEKPALTIALDDILAQAPRPNEPSAPAVPGGVTIAVLVGFDAAGTALVNVFDSHEPLPARSTVALAPADCGREVAVAFERGDVRAPVVLGVLRHPAALSAIVDGHDRVDITAEREVVLRCGKASITLTKAGKVLIEGDYVLTRSAGVNRIKGGSVQIN